MITVAKVFPNTYRDSVLLMKIASKIREKEGINNAEVMMATPINKKFLSKSNLSTEKMEEAGPNDILIVIMAEQDVYAEEAISDAEKMVNEGSPGENAVLSVKNFFSALAQMPDANLALISVPGEYVKDIAVQALKKGLHLLIFSDNVPIESELEIKEMAKEQKLLVMGPDCGTAIINGVALAFANKVRRGPIGLVGASGTGLQQVSTLLHQYGLGVSSAIGTGTNDVTDAIGGLTMLQGIEMLEQDPSTEVIVLISKPPSSFTRDKILARLRECKKPVVINFLGYQKENEKNIHYTVTLEEAAQQAAELVQPGTFESQEFFHLDKEHLVSAQAKRCVLVDTQKFVRGLFAGGTLAAEAGVIIREMISQIYGNIKLPGVTLLEDSSISMEHTIIDLGADEFTVGRPHPMIDSTVRGERLLQEAGDREVAVILLDFILGYGSNSDPVGSMAKYIEKAVNIAKEDGRELVILASVCGTDEDPQDMKEQVKKLKDLGVLVFPSNDKATKAAMIITMRV